MAEVRATQAFANVVDALYLHVPFCRSKCCYCNFFSVCRATPEDIDLWCKTVKRELLSVKNDAAQNQMMVLPLQSIYFGGGTPSLLEAPMIDDILLETAKLFGIAPDAEITLEANPDSFLRGTFASDVRKSGVNRVSIGVQSLDDKVLKLCGRRHTAREARLSLQRAGDVGFSHISADLITGLAASNCQIMQQNMSQILQLPLDHLSVYALEISPHTAYFRLKTKHPELFPDDEAEREEDLIVRSMCADKGFLHYEISSYAKENCYARHNLVYWQALPYLGIGPGASSFMAATRRTAPSDLAKWRQIVEAEGAFATSTIDEVLDIKAMEHEYIWLSFRLSRGLDTADFKSRFGRDFLPNYKKQIDGLLKKGLINRTKNGFAISSYGLDYADLVFLEFV